MDPFLLRNEPIFDQFFFAFTVQYLCGIAVDWQTGNLYLVSSLNSNVFVCNTTSSDLICTRVSTVGAYFSGIAVDPLSGYADPNKTKYIGVGSSEMN